MKLAVDCDEGSRVANFEEWMKHWKNILNLNKTHRSRWGYWTISLSRVLVALGTWTWWSSPKHNEPFAWEPRAFFASVKVFGYKFNPESDFPGRKGPIRFMILFLRIRHRGNNILISWTTSNYSCQLSKWTSYVSIPVHLQQRWHGFQAFPHHTAEARRMSCVMAWNRRTYWPNGPRDKEARSWLEKTQKFHFAQSSCSPLPAIQSLK